MDVVSDEVLKGRDMLSEVPPEIWTRFLSFIALPDVVALTEVNKRLRALATYHVEELSRNDPKNGEAFLSMLRLFPNLRSLRLDRPHSLGDLEFLHVSQLPHLTSLSVRDLTGMSDPQSLFRAMWSCKELRHLEIDFGQHMPFDEDFSSICTLIAVNKLEHFTLHHTPEQWTLMQAPIISCMRSLQTLEISYNVAPTSLDFLAPLTRLRHLRLYVINGSHAGLKYELPHLPQLEKLETPDICLSDTSIARLSKLRSLIFTPWGWKRKDLMVFEQLPLLKHLSIRVNWLPNADFLDRIFRHLVSLTLIEFDVSRFTVLHNLRNLKVLCIDTPTKLNSPAKSKYLKPIADTIRAMPWLIGFSLINTYHLTQEIQVAILAKESSIRILELSGCENCIHSFIDESNTCELTKLEEITVHVEGLVHKWRNGEDQFRVVTTAHGGFNYFPTHTF